MFIGIIIKNGTTHLCAIAHLGCSLVLVAKACPKQLWPFLNLKLLPISAYILVLFLYSLRLAYSITMSKSFTTCMSKRRYDNEYK